MANKSIVTTPVRWCSTLVLILVALAMPIAGTHAQEASSDTDRGRLHECGDEPTGRILFVPVDDTGQSSAGLSVANPATGETVATIDLPIVERLNPLRSTGKAIASAEDGAYYLVDGFKAIATRLDISVESGLLFEWWLGVPLGVGEHKTILTDGRDAFLLDLDSAVTTDLRSLLPAGSPEIPLQPILSPDERFVLLWDALQLWLVPTADPAAARPLSDGRSPIIGTFSSDSTLVIYNRRIEGGDGRELVIEPVDGFSPPEVIAAGKVVTGVFLGGNDLIAIERVPLDIDEPVMELLTISRESGDERVLLTHDINPVSLTPSPDGARLLLRISPSLGGFEYTTIELESGEATGLLFLNGLISFSFSGSTVGLAMPLIGVGDEPAVPGFYAIDLDTGSSTILAPIELDDVIAISQPLFSRDGLVALSSITSQESQSIWRLDLAAGKGTIVHEGPVAGASLSPDGCWVTIGQVTTSGDKRIPMITVQQPGEEQSLSIGAGWQPVWVDD